jgi:hypothetical protein
MVLLLMYVCHSQERLTEDCQHHEGRSMHIKQMPMPVEGVVAGYKDAGTGQPA